MTEIKNASLTTDIVLICKGHVLLIRREWPPYEGHWALPGGYLDDGETLAEAAERELLEETAVETDRLLTQAGVYDAPGRDPRGRVISVAHVAVLDHMPEPAAGDDARDAQWVPVEEAFAGSLAFDHRQILTDALRQI